MHYLILIAFVSYTILLFVITRITAKNANSQSFFVGNRKSPWFVVAYGMIGASLSGVTFMSVPGWVGERSFAYLMLVFGYLIGYMVVAFVLLPLYYRLNLTTIYTYLGGRFGAYSHKTGSFFFLLSRTLGASLRMFLVINVLQYLVFDYWHIPFALTVGIFIILILLYTFKGGIKTIIWTDSLQTTFMLLSLIISIVLIAQKMNFGFMDMLSAVSDSKYSQVIFTDSKSPLCWWKQLLGGMFITICMTGLDQEMMQKNLSCKNLRAAQKNMLSFSVILIVVNFIFLLLGAVLYLYKNQVGIDATGDNLFPFIAINHLGAFAGMVFIIGLISALYPSADGALTSLTTAFTIDFLRLHERKDLDEQSKTRKRYLVHLGFAVLLAAIIIFYKQYKNDHLIQILFKIASLTYGPLLGLFAFGLILKRPVRDRWTPIVCVLAPVICFFLDHYSKVLFWGYQFDFELLLINGLITFLGMWMISRRAKKASF